MGRVNGVADELKLLFARLFESDVQIEELEGQIEEKRKRQIPADEIELLSKARGEQKQIIADLIFVSREYWGNLKNSYKISR